MNGSDRDKIQHLRRALHMAVMVHDHLLKGEETEKLEQACMEYCRTVLKDTEEVE